MHDRLVKVAVFLLFVSIYLFGQEFRYSQIKNIPDFSFAPHVFTGLDILEQLDIAPLKGKKIAVLCNQTAVNRGGEHLLEILASNGIEVKTLFAPEFGLFGSGNKRLKLFTKEKNIEPTTGARIIDLFGEHIYPPDESIIGIDLILVDIQDTGVRYSTFITTITKIMETASKNNIPVLILDRPNPLRGDVIDGPVVRPAYQSFEGYHLVPIRHGYTIGEFILMVNEMGWAKDLARVDLTVIPMANWKRDHWFNETGLPWVQPTPDISDLETLLAFSGMALLKGTNLNTGHGTDKPYLRVGAPWLSGHHLMEKLNALSLSGVRFSVIKYKPMHRQGMKFIPLYLDEICNGIEIEITDRNEFDPLAISTAIIITTKYLYPREFQWASNNYIDKLFGSNILRTFTAQGKPADYLPPLWFHDILRFSEFRQRFYLY